tara:strand:+ start:5252 stop:6301 length:1050 start_codon:yes stop_codon:yes gene_type:complete
MPTQYQYRYVTLTKETEVYGTAGAVSLTGEVDDESIQHQYDMMARSDMSYLGTKKALAGKTHSEGGINLVCQPDDFCAMILRGVYNSYTFTTGSATVAHVMTESTAVNTGSAAAQYLQQLPSFNVKVGREDKTHLYTGMCISRVSMAANVGEYVTMSADFVGRQEGTLTALTVPTFDGGADDGMHFAQAEVFFDDGSGTAPTDAGDLIKSFSLEWNTNLNTDSCCGLGSRVYTVRPAPQLREITGTLEFSRPVITASNDEPDYAAAQNSAGLIYDPAAARMAIKLVLTDTASPVNTLMIEINKVIWDAPVMNVSGRDASTMSLGFTALVDAGGIMSKVSWGNSSTQTLA